MTHVLNKTEILDLFKVKNLLAEGSCRKSDMFMDFINEYVKQSNDDSVLSQFQLNNNNMVWANTIKLSMEFANVMENKIVLFSDLYWSLYHYGDSQQNKTIWNPPPHTKKEALNYYNYLMSLQDKRLLHALTEHMQNLPEVNNEMVELWYELIKDNKKELKNLPPYNFIDKYNNLDLMENKVIKQAQLYTLFEKNAAFEKIQHLYEKYKKVGVLEKKLYAIIQKYDNNYPQYLFAFSETSEDIIYRSKTVFNMEYLLQNYQITPNQGQNFLNVLTNYINAKSPQHYVRPTINISKSYVGYNELISMEVILETYSQNYLNDAKKWLEESTLFAAEYLLSSQYRDNLTDNTYKENKLTFVDFATEYIEKGLAMKALEKELPLNDIKVSRPKI